jgi:hypothetical protein
MATTKESKIVMDRIDVKKKKVEVNLEDVGEYNYIMRASWCTGD